MRARVLLVLFLATVVLLAPALVAGASAHQSGEQSQEEEQEEERETTNIEEVVVVTASRTEQLLLEAPTSVSVIDSADIALSPAQNYADLLRRVPGLNVTQTSARDVNMSTRSATSTLDASQLVLIDGRSVYQDFFGFVAWDLLPLDFNEIEQIEVVRGPGSAVWGANAMSGVVNIITKNPATYGRNFFRVRAGGGERGTGFAGFTWAGMREKIGFKLAASYYTQDSWDRPGPLPNGIARDSFPNTGTSQPKFDGRLDINTDGSAWWSVSAGYSGTGGIIHTGIGPFQLEDGSKFWHLRGDYNWQSLNVRAYVNVLRGRGTNVLNGLLFSFDSETYDFSATNTTNFSGRHAATYGASVRTINFDLSIAPREDKRTEGGGFLQLDLNLSDYFALDAGVRVDKFSNIESAVYSPRGGVLIRPTGRSNHVLRFGYGRAFRAPSMINNFLDVTIFNLVELPFVGPFVFPTTAVGNPALTEEKLDQIEFGYRGSVDNGKFSWDLVWFRTETKESIDFYPSAAYTAFNPPPGWPLPAFLLPPFGPVVLPSQFSYRNIGEFVNQGVEVGVRWQLVPRNTLAINYTYAKEPEATGVPADEYNIPPKNKFNVAWNGYSGLWFYGASYNYVDAARWTDVLDSRFWGTTDSYYMLNASLGMMFNNGLGEISVRGTNITDQPVLQHIYGDLIGRRVVLEVALNIG